MLSLACLSSRLRVLQGDCVCCCVVKLALAGRRRFGDSSGCSVDDEAAGGSEVRTRAFRRAVTVTGYGESSEGKSECRHEGEDESSVAMQGSECTRYRAKRALGLYCVGAD